jgi:cell division septation protein DedD
VDYLVKDRLTGAIILVVVIVLLVPELLSGPKGPARSAGTGLSASSEEAPLRSYTINLADDSHTHAEAAGGPSMPQPSQAESAATSAAADAPAPAGAVAGSPASGSAANTVPDSGSGAAPTNTAPGSRAPPATIQSASPAASAASRSATNTGHAGNPSGTREASASTARPAVVRSGPGVAAGNGWMLQIGVFARRENAEHLAADVRTRGLRASVSEVSGSGRKLYRVRVGPAADRAAAQEMQARLKAIGRPSGTLIPPS